MTSRSERLVLKDWRYKSAATRSTDRRERSEVVATRDAPWPSCRPQEWARHLGALSQKPMTASWFGSTRFDRIQGCGAEGARQDGLPSDLFVSLRPMETAYAREDVALKKQERSLQHLEARQKGSSRRSRATRALAPRLEVLCGLCALRENLSAAITPC